jgi:hypothetical protein
MTLEGRLTLGAGITMVFPFTIQSHLVTVSTAFRNTQREIFDDWAVIGRQVLSLDKTHGNTSMEDLNTVPAIAVKSSTIVGIFNL